MFVASTAVAEVKSIADRAFFFKDMGPDNHYLLVINQATPADAKGIEAYLKGQMGDKFMFERVFGLPTIPYMAFGNMRSGVDPTVLPVMASDPASIHYKRCLQQVANHIIAGLAK